MYELWDCESTTGGSYVVVQNRHLDVFEYYQAENAFEAPFKEIKVLAAVGDEAASILVDYLNLKNGFLRLDDLPPDSFLAIWSKFLRLIPEVDPATADYLRTLIHVRAPKILPRAPLVADCFIEWANVCWRAYRTLRLVLLPGLVGTYKDANAHSIKMSVDLINPWVKDITKKTDGAFGKSNWANVVSSYSSAMRHLFSDVAKERVLAQVAFLLALASKEVELHKPITAIACLHRSLDLYFLLVLLRAGLGRVSADGRIRYKSELTAGKGPAQSREALSISYGYCVENGLVGDTEEDIQLVNRINDYRNEAPLFHGYSHASAEVISELLAGTKKLLFRLEDDNRTLDRWYVTFRRAYSPSFDLIWEVHPELSGYIIDGTA